MVKTDSPEQLVQAVRVVASGESLLGPEVTRRLIERFLAGRTNVTMPPTLATLTDREVEVLKLVAAGLSNRGDRRCSVRERGHRQNPRRPDAVETGPA